MKWKYKNKYTARLLGCLVFSVVVWIVLFFAILDSLKISAKHIYYEMVDFTERALINGWKSWK